MAYKKLTEKPLAFTDVETTGLDPVVNEMLEFACIKGDETLVLKIKPRRIHTAHPKALGVNGYNEAEWVDAEDITTAAPKIIAFLRDAVFVAHNAKFDVSFIEAFLKEAGISERISYHVLDTVTLAYEHLVPCGIESLSLDHVCPVLGISNDGNHRALTDVIRCKAVYESLSMSTPADRERWSTTIEHMRSV